MALSFDMGSGAARREKAHPSAPITADCQFETARLVDERDQLGTVVLREVAQAGSQLRLVVNEPARSAAPGRGASRAGATHYCTIWFSSFCDSAWYCASVIRPWLCSDFSSLSFATAAAWLLLTAGAAGGGAWYVSVTWTVGTGGG